MKKAYIIDDDALNNEITKVMTMDISDQIKIEYFLEAEPALKNIESLIDTNPDDFPDYIIVDINLPGMDGFEFANAFVELMKEKKCKPVDLYLISTSDIEKYVTQAKENPNIKEFFVKSINNNIADKLKELLQKG